MSSEMMIVCNLKGANIRTMVNCLKGEDGRIMECDKKTDFFFYLNRLRLFFQDKCFIQQRQLVCGLKRVVKQPFFLNVNFE